MSATMLPELASESVETAERLARLSTGETLDPTEAEYLFATGLSALERVPKLWPIIRTRIGGGMTGASAHELLAQLIHAANKNIGLAQGLKKRADLLRAPSESDSETAIELGAAERQLVRIRAEAMHLMAVIDAPARWPTAVQLNEAKERVASGNRLTAEEFRRTLLDE